MVAAEASVTAEYHESQTKRGSTPHSQYLYPRKRLSILHLHCSGIGPFQAPRSNYSRSDSCYLRKHSRLNIDDLRLCPQRIQKVTKVPCVRALLWTTHSFARIDRSRMLVEPPCSSVEKSTKLNCADMRSVCQTRLRQPLAVRIRTKLNGSRCDVHSRGKPWLQHVATRRASTDVSGRPVPHHRQLRKF